MSGTVLQKRLIVGQEHHELRLDNFLTQQLPEFSRSFFKNVITQGKVLVNDKVETKAGLVLKTDDVVTLEIPDFLSTQELRDVSSINAEIVFEHPDFIIINKHAGVLVHAPNPKCDQPTLVDWLIQKFKEIVEVGNPERPGIVHRLDMNTSGLMVVPRTNFAHKVFSDMFKDRTIKKTYIAVVEGHPDKEGTVDLNIVRHPALKNRMTHVPHKDIDLAKYTGSRSAITNYKVLKYYENAALVEIKLITGRTHQVRVHFAALGHPLIGDTIYGKISPLIGRHALHAGCLEFIYNDKKYVFEQPLPEDMQQLIAQLKEYKF